MARLTVFTSVLINFAILYQVVSGDTLNDIDEHLAKTMKPDSTPAEIISETLNWTELNLSKVPFFCFGCHTPESVREELQELYNIVGSISCDTESTSEANKIRNSLTYKGSRSSRPLGKAIVVFHNNYLNSCIEKYTRMVNESYEEMKSKGELESLIRVIDENSELCLRFRATQQEDKNLLRLECLANRSGGIGQYVEPMKALVRESLEKDRYAILFDSRNDNGVLEANFKNQLNERVANPCIEHDTKVSKVFEHLKSIVALTKKPFPQELMGVRFRVQAIEKQCRKIGGNYERIIDALVRSVRV